MTRNAVLARQNASSYFLNALGAAEESQAIPTELSGFINLAFSRVVYHPWLEEEEAPRTECSLHWVFLETGAAGKPTQALRVEDHFRAC